MSDVYLKKKKNGVDFTSTQEHKDWEVHTHWETVWFPPGSHQLVRDSSQGWVRRPPPITIWGETVTQAKKASTTEQHRKTVSVIGPLRFHLF